MSRLGPRAPEDRVAGEGGREETIAGEPADGYTPIAGERGVPSVNRARSLQSRVSSILAIALMSSLGLGLLTWYYAGAFTRTSRAQTLAQNATRSRAQGEMALPSLGHIEPPLPLAPKAAAAASDPPLAEQLLGPPPGLPVGVAGANDPPGNAPAFVPAAYTGSQPKSPGEQAFERRLSGPVFAKVASSSSEGASAPSALASSTDPPPFAVGATRAEPARESSSELSKLLEPSATPTVRARLLPTRRFLLGKGAFIDCTLETAIDSTLPGLTTCVTATDTFSSDGTVVLLERGTKLVGETRGQVQQGAARLFVLWSEARTPTGVVVPLSSPGTDELGRSGLPGEVNRHFWDRFGAAILISIIDAGLQAGVQAASHNNGTVIVNPSATQDVMTEVLRSTVAIPPTLTKAQGDRIQILVARDVDFRSVYELKTAASGGVEAP
jgi:type IV secretion system protein VirB10